MYSRQFSLHLVVIEGVDEGYEAPGLGLLVQS
uniref:Uncharacterized protein n=1 Tax=Anguilla anguilla TaxID=7936 RepID=A0A0E9RGR8_ANGAN